MKLNILKFALILAFASNVSVAQVLKYEDFPSITSTKGEFTSYIASDGHEYKIGDRLKIGVPSSNKTFAFIWEGDGLLLPFTNLTAISSGQETEIKRIVIAGGKRAGYTVAFRTKGATGLANYSIQFENALATKEINGFGKTSEEALTELKNAKDKLDLGLITQEDYDKLKAELSKYIK